MNRYIFTLRCQDRPGIILAFADAIVRATGNIVENAQFSDPDTGVFCMRTAFDSPLGSVDAIRELLTVSLASFDPVMTLRPEAERRRALIMVSTLDHCLIDLLYRWDIGELPIEIPVVVSNHQKLRTVVERYGIDFVHVPVTAATKPDAEARLLEIIKQNDVDFVVLARYMQVLSDDVCTTLAGRVMNIHHSFLPGFKGAKPYHQAHRRGVKLIGATAHFVTSELDEGPIIDQDVARVGHAHSTAELIALGRDIERVVLARAVRSYAEDRVLITGQRTVVFA